MRDSSHLKRHDAGTTRLLIHRRSHLILKGSDQMFGQHGKTFFLTLIALSLLVPLALMVWNPQIGAIAFLCGLATAARCIGLIRTLQVEGSLHDQHALYASANQAQTIFVQLIDEDGNDLTPEVAEAKLAAAQLQAGPRDMVVGVRHKVG
jgi:hypothetical protein